MDNHYLTDERLSLKAKGLFCVITDVYQGCFTLEEMQKITIDGKTSIRTALIELERHGYLEIHIPLAKGGRFQAKQYIIHKKPSHDIRNAV